MTNSLRLAVEHFNDVPHAAIQPCWKRRVLQQLCLSVRQGTSYNHVKGPVRMAALSQVGEGLLGSLVSYHPEEIQH